MIGNYLFHTLSQDATDQTALDVLVAVNARMRLSLAQSQVPEWAYLSLKTLLGSTQIGNNIDGVPKWAVERIKAGKANEKFTDVHTPPDLPLIQVNVTNLRDHPKRNNLGATLASVEFLIVTDPNAAPSSKAWDIAKRIETLFTVFTPSGLREPRDIAAGVTDIKGITSLRLRWQTWPECNWDIQRCSYEADAQIIT